MKKKSTLLHPSKIAFCFLLFLFSAFTASSQTNWYYNGSGPLNNTSSWGTNTNGTGTAPTDFITASQVFIIQNATNITFSSGTWTVSGTGSKIVLGNPTYATPGTATPAITLTIASGSSIVATPQLFEVSIPSSGNHKIIYQNTTALSLGTVNDSNLELVFDGATIATTTSKTYGNISLINGANIDMSAASPTLKDLTINQGCTLSGPIGSSAQYIVVKSGGVVTINGTFKAGRSGSVTARGGLYTTGTTTSSSTTGTLLFADATEPPNITLGSQSTVEYYRGNNNPATGNSQTGTQGITPMAYANLILSNESVASSKSFNISGTGSNTTTVSGTLTVNLLSGASITAATTQNITLKPGARLVINSATAFPAPSGTGKLILQSDATGTASIGTLATLASVTGNVTVQQYIPAGFRKYRFLSHPFTTAQSLSQLTDNIDITGNTAGTTNVGGQIVGSGFTSTTANNPSAYYFNTATADGGAPNDAGWKAFLDATTSSWAKGQGARFLIRGTKAQTGTLDGTNASPNAVTLDMAGTINTGDVVVNLVTGGTGSTTGFNMVGNPYPSPVDLGAVLTAASNIGSSFYLRNPQTGNYITVPVSASYIIPASTAFFIKANAPTSLTFTEASKSTCTSCATLFRNNNVHDNLQIKAFQNGLEYDNVYLKLGKYTSAYDETNDAVKLTNDALNIYVISSDNKKLAVDYRSIENNDIIPLGLSLPVAYGTQTYSLKVSDLQIDAQTTLVLHDKLNNSYTELKENAVYTLQVDPSNTASVGESRLEIIVSQKPAPTPMLNVNLNEGVEIYATADAITITNKSTTAIKKSIMNLLNMDGQNILSQNLNLEAGAKVSIPIKQLAAGMYAVQLLMTDNRLTKKIFKP